MNKIQDVLIIGNNENSKNIYETFSKLFSVDIYDPFDPEHLFSYQNGYNIAFVCCPTEMNPDGSTDYSLVEESLSIHKSSIFVIKSTLPIGVCDKLKKKYNVNIVYSPENKDHIVLAGSQNHCDIVASYYHKLNSELDLNFKLYFTDYLTAELSSYMGSCYNAILTTFFCEFATISKSFGISYPQLCNSFDFLDSNKDFKNINPDKLYFDDEKLKKELPSLVLQTDKAHLIKKTLEINKQKRLDLEY